MYKTERKFFHKKKKINAFKVSNYDETTVLLAKFKHRVLHLRAVNELLPFGCQLKKTVTFIQATL